MESWKEFSFVVLVLFQASQRAHCQLPHWSVYAVGQPAICAFDCHLTVGLTSDFSKAEDCCETSMWNIFVKLPRLWNEPGLQNNNCNNNNNCNIINVEVKWTFRLTVLKKLQVPQCTTSRPVQPAHYFKWEHLRRKGGLSKHSSKHFSRERDTRKGSTRGATKEATGTVTCWVLLRWLFAVERAVIIIDGCISWLICVMILTKQHTAYRQQSLAFCLSIFCGL